MKIGITGAHGFVGWHFRAYLHSTGVDQELRLASRETFADPVLLDQFVDGLDVVVHLAGVNRGEEEALHNGNKLLASELVASLERVGARASVVFASSIHEHSGDSAYSKGKREAGEILQAYCEGSGNPYLKYLIPHVFGEFGKPFYNSVVSTFCHQLVQGESLEVNADGGVELVHVQDLVERIGRGIELGEYGEHRVQGTPMSVGELARRLESLLDIYTRKEQVPMIEDELDRSLFNTLRSYLSSEARVVKLHTHTDQRGSLTELIKVNSGGQCFFSQTNSGFVRGNHYHRRKFERFAVIRGNARIRVRKLFSDQVEEYLLNGDAPAFLDIPTLHTHNIENIGDSELLTLFWSNEIFDPKNPDTYRESV